MNSAFMQYVFSGLTVGAYANRFELSIPTLLRALTGLSEAQPELETHEVRKTLRLTDTAFLYVAMKGPRGSVRWHQWHVRQDVARAILNDEEEYREVRNEPGRLHLFSTLDNLVVAINPQHIVTAISGIDESPRFLEHVALVPSMLVSGDLYLPETQTTVLQKFHNNLKQAPEELTQLETQTPDEDIVYTVANCHGWFDRRPSIAFLRDLKNPIQDHLWASGLAEETIATSETLCTALGTAIHIDDKIYMPISVTMVDADGVRMGVQLPADQISVLQASRWTVERTALERQYQYIKEHGGSDLELTPDSIRNACKELGLFGSGEIEGIVSSFQEVFDRAPAQPAKRRKHKAARKPVVLDS